jgi:hypothetical protein
MLSELKEVQYILEKSEDIEEAKKTIEQSIQIVLHHQIVYSDSHTVPKKFFDFIVNNINFFEKYFMAAGFNLSYDHKTQMFALSQNKNEDEIYGIRLNRLKKDETYTRLVLKYLYIDGFKSGDMDSLGRVGVLFTDFLNSYRNLTTEEPPNYKQLKERILRVLQKKGVIRLTEDTIIILPGINIIIPDRYLENFVNSTSKQAEEGSE